MKNNFDKKIERQNRWKALTAGLSFIVVGTLLCMLFNVCQQNVSELFIFSIFIIFILSNGVTWFFATAQRHDLYSVVRQNSVTQLKRFKTEIENVIEEIEQENK